MYWIASAYTGEKVNVFRGKWFLKNSFIGNAVSRVREQQNGKLC